MAHRNHGLRNAGPSADRENPVEEWNECGNSFQRESLGPEITRLNDLFEDVGTNELREYERLIGSRRDLLDVLLEPLPLFRAGYMHKLCGNGSAVITARLFGNFAFRCWGRKWLGGKVLAQRI